MEKEKGECEIRLGKKKYEWFTDDEKLHLKIQEVNIR